MVSSSVWSFYRKLVDILFLLFFKELNMFHVLQPLEVALLSHHAHIHSLSVFKVAVGHSIWYVLFMLLSGQMH